MSSLLRAEIADLDDDLSEDGEWIIVRRTVGSGASAQNDDVRCRAFIRALQPKELAGAVNQTVWSVILSPMQIIAAQWPGGHPITTNEDPRVPRATQDKVIFSDRDQRERAISASKPIYIDGDLVRIDLLVIG